ncbi:pfkB family kinase [Penicillium brasilianum]|uniref:PfkB family kinase n=1 Tax=Penicillium brasilianum TaxID=104259 RepID=A0A1S9RAJ8_PENBI|nr:pfkB family kinase [Penicillium brasilianum]
MQAANISFTSLGLVVLDEIRFPNRTPLTDILGGSGTYATLGARLFLPPPSSPTVGWVINVGSDFPDPVKEQLESWKTTLCIRERVDVPSTRGLLEYKDTTFGPKDFRYATPVLAVQEDSLKHTTLLASCAFHYLASPEDLKVRVSKLLHLQAEAGIHERPLIIWEPAPLSCRPENLEACLEAAALVDVLSPNHLELAKLFSEPQSDVIDKTKVEELAFKCLDRGIGPDGSGTVIVRAGENGCFISDRKGLSTWLDPFYTTKPGEMPNAKIVDPTGAGNAFLGSYAVGCLKTGSVVKAACYGSVGASFALEQVGVPLLSVQGNEESWNGVKVLSRLEEYMARQNCGQGATRIL